MEGFRGCLIEFTVLWLVALRCFGGLCVIFRDSVVILSSRVGGSMKNDITTLENVTTLSSETSDPAYPSERGPKRNKSEEGIFFISFCFIVTNKYTINIINVFITAKCNLYSYMFRHFCGHHQGVYICASLSYTSFPNYSFWKYNFVTLRCSTSRHISS